MKRLIYLLFFATVFVCCNDDAMELYPLTSISGETYWNTESDLQVYNNIFYNYAQSDGMRLLNGNGTGASGQYSLDGMTDNDVKALAYHANYTRIRAGQIYPDSTLHRLGGMTIVSILSGQSISDLQTMIMLTFLNQPLTNTRQRPVCSGLGLLPTKCLFMAIIHGLIKS